jgi:ABC-type Fe3+-siderophore transport system permease subunit
MYETAITSLVWIGFIASAVYVPTWTPGAIKAYCHGTTRLKGWQIIDFAALPAACFIILALNVVNILETGVQPATTPGLAIQRVTTIAFITAIVILRLIRWTLTYRESDEEERATGAANLTDRDRRTS